MAEDNMNPRNKTGVTGVSWSNRNLCYIAQLQVGGRNVLYKRFRTVEAAAAARKEAETRYAEELAKEWPGKRKKATTPDETMLS